jgi:hypothetical protein
MDDDVLEVFNSKTEGEGPEKRIRMSADWTLCCCGDVQSLKMIRELKLWNLKVDLRLGLGARL